MAKYVNLNKTVSFVLLSCIQFLCFNTLRSQSFMIGSFLHGTNELKYNGTGLSHLIEQNPTDLSGNYTSILNVMSQDGFNLMRTYWPDPSMLKTNYVRMAKLADNNGMQVMDHLGFWFRPTPPPGVNLKTTFHTGIFEFNTSPVNTNYIGWNYDWLYNNVYNDPTVSHVFYAHGMGSEFSNFHHYQIANIPAYWCDNVFYECWNPPSPTNPNWNNPCQMSGQALSSEIPPQVLSDVIKYQRLTYPSVTHSISSGLTKHNGYIYDGFVDCYVGYPMNGIYQPQHYLTFPSVVNPSKPDIINEDSYYSNAFRDWSINDNYLGKFKNIDYIHSKGYSHILSEYSISKEDENSIYQLHSNPTIQNANMLRFLIYTSIIHGIDAVNFYTIYSSSGYYISDYTTTPPTYSLDLEFDPDGLDAIRRANMKDATLATRFQRSNFSYVYQNFVSKITRELRYLANNGSLTPNNSGMLYQKLGANVADPNGIVEPSTNYLPSVIASADLKDYNAVNNYPANQTASNLKRGEDHGIRYIITTNNSGEAVMIVSNPNPYSIHNVDFSFSGVPNLAIQNANAVDVLFDDGNVSNVNAANYKTDISPSVEASTFNLLKKYTIKFCADKKITSDFGPFDVKVFTFKKVMDPTPAYANGWQNVWTNGGNNTIGSWGGLNNSILTDKFIPIDFNKDGDDELLCVQSYNSDGPLSPNVDAWATVIDYNGSAWNTTPLFTNLGNGSFNKLTYSGWTIGALDKYIVGDFDGDGFNNELLCIQSNGPWACILRANTSTMNFDWYWSNNGLGTLNTSGTGWSILPADKFVVGDFNGDNKNNDLLCVQSISAGTWGIFNFSNAFPLNFNLHWGNGSGNLMGNPTWPIGPNDELIAGNFDGGTSSGNLKNEVLCIERGIGNRVAILKKIPGSFSSMTEWSVTNGIVAGWGPTIAADNKVIVGNIDADVKDEMMFVQSCQGCGWATTEDLNAGNTAPQWNWSNHDYTGPQKDYIADWRVSDTYASNVKYLFLKPILGQRNHLLAFKNYGCGNFLISQYKTTGASNYKTNSQPEFINVKETEDHVSSITVFPNPNTGAFLISTNSKNEKEIIVMDFVGRVVYKNKTAENKLEIKLPQVSKGIYFIRVVEGEKSDVKKIVVE